MEKENSNLIMGFRPRYRCLIDTIVTVIDEIFLKPRMTSKSRKPTESCGGSTAVGVPRKYFVAIHTLSQYSKMARRISEKDRKTRNRGEVSLALKDRDRCTQLRNVVGSFRRKILSHCFRESRKHIQTFDYSKLTFDREVV
jgi:hypothetical protein